MNKIEGPENNNFIEDIQMIIKYLTSRHPVLSWPTVFILNLCAIITIPFMLVAFILILPTKLVKHFRKGETK